MRPKGAAWDEAVARWRVLPSDRGRGVRPRGDAGRAPRSSRWSPGAPARRTRCRSPGAVPDPAAEPDPERRDGHAARARLYGPGAGHAAGGHPGRPRVHRLLHQQPDRGSARRGRRRARAAAWPRACAAWVVPGSGLIKRAGGGGGARPGLRPTPGSNGGRPGCSMCLGTNGEIVAPGERCASTSNRNFVGRQGPGARTHLMSPAMAAAAAVTGRLTDVRSWMGGWHDAVHARSTRWRCRSRSRTSTPTRSSRRASSSRDRDLGLAECLFHDLRFDADGAEKPDFVLNQPAYRAARDRGGGAQFRLRLVARERGLGAVRLRLPRGDRAELRRHLPQQLLQERLAAGGAAGGCGGRPAGAAAGDAGRACADRSAGADRDVAGRDAA